MGEFEVISEKYCRAGISIDNIEYAVTAVKFGSRPDQIIENLKVGYKSLNDEQANALLQDLFAANMIETKRRKRLVFAFGLFYCAVGFVSAYFLFHAVIFRSVLHRPVLVALLAIAGLLSGFYCFSRLLKIEPRAFMPKNR